MQEEKKLNTWAVLSSIDCNEHTEKKDKLTYLSWAWAWGIAKAKYPTLTYSVRDWDGLPYLYDENLGYMVETSVTIDGETLTMRLPVMNSANKAMKAEAYFYYVNTWKNGEKVREQKVVEAATMFDINTAIMRCLTKNLAMFGLGHYIYAGEDLPTVADEVYFAERDKAIAEMMDITDKEELKKYCQAMKPYYGQDKEFVAAAKELLTAIKKSEAETTPAETKENDIK